MKRKILLATLIVAALMLGACGKKEEVKETTTTTEIEEVVETPETVETPEIENPIAVVEDGIPAIADMSSVVVNEPLANTLVVGNINQFDWGTFEIVSNENGFNKGVLNFFDTSFEIELPQDVGVNTYYDSDVFLALHNSTKSRVFDFIEWEINDYDVETMKNWGKEEYVEYLYKDTSLVITNSYFFKEMKGNLEYSYLEVTTNTPSQLICILIRDDVNKKMVSISYLESNAKSFDIGRKVISSFKFVEQETLETSNTEVEAFGLENVNWPSNAEIIRNENNMSVSILGFETIEAAQPILDEIVKNTKLKNIIDESDITEPQIMILGSLIYKINDKTLTIQCMENPMNNKYDLFITCN